LDPEANLAYGYDLGTYESFKAAERGQYDQPNLPWFRTENPDDPDADVDGPHNEFETALYLTLYQAIPDAPAIEDAYDAEAPVKEHFGVALEQSGAEGSFGWILAVLFDDDGDTRRTVEWADALPLDLDELAALPAAGGWDDRLSQVLAVLGITPLQDRPRWLVFPTYT
jgi:hypothetical protein